MHPLQSGHLSPIISTTTTIVKTTTIIIITIISPDLYFDKATLNITIMILVVIVVVVTCFNAKLAGGLTLLSCARNTVPNLVDVVVLMFCICC